MRIKYPDKDLTAAKISNAVLTTVASTLTTTASPDNQSGRYRRSMSPLYRPPRAYKARF